MAVTRSNGALARLATPFWNGEQQRVRALWRIVGAVLIVLTVPTALSAAVVRPLALPLMVSGLASVSLYATTTLLVLVAWARYVDRRPLAAYGFRVDRDWVAAFALGALAGVLGWGGALATDLLAGWATVEAVFTGGDSPLVVGLTAGVLQFLLVGFWEEVVFRGIVMRDAIEGLDLPGVPRRWVLAGGWVASSVLFGVVHFGQAGSALALGFWVLAGLVFGLAYMLTDSLALPIGLHAATDVSVNHLWGLGAVVGGDQVERVPMVVRPAFTGPERFVGVAGLVNTGWLVVIGVAVVGIVWFRQGSFRPSLSVRNE